MLALGQYSSVYGKLNIWVKDIKLLKKIFYYNINKDVIVALSLHFD